MKKFFKIVFTFVFMVIMFISIKSLSSTGGLGDVIDLIFYKEKTDDMDKLYENIEKHKDDNEKINWIYENFNNLSDKEIYLVGNDIDTSEFVYNLENGITNFESFSGESVNYDRLTLYYLQWVNRWAYS